MFCVFWDLTSVFDIYAVSQPILMNDKLSQIFNILYEVLLSKIDVFFQMDR